MPIKCVAACRLNSGQLAPKQKRFKNNNSNGFPSVFPSSLHPLLHPSSLHPSLPGCITLVAAVKETPLSSPVDVALPPVLLWYGDTRTSHPDAAHIWAGAKRAAGGIPRAGASQSEPGRSYLGDGEYKIGRQAEGAQHLQHHRAV